LNREECLLAFSALQDIQMDIRRKILNFTNGPEGFFAMPQKQLELLIEERCINPFIANQLLEIHAKPPLSLLQKQLEDKKINFITDQSPLYPKELLTIKDPPLYLFYQGELPQNDQRIAVIGARNCSPYGKEVALCFSKIFAKCGITVVSGMARGIDGFAHEGALAASGKTIAVLGFGLDECYPRENYGLMQRIREKGCLISEYAPGTKARPLNFPARNRLIAGLSQGLLVIEAAKKSGTLITVDFALEQGKNIYTVPGRIGDPLSAGCNELIKNGCTPVTDPKEILMDYGIILENDKEKYQSMINELDMDVKLVYERADVFTKYIDEFVNETGLSLNTVMGALLELEIRGFISQPVHGAYIRMPEIIV